MFFKNFEMSKYVHCRFRLMLTLSESFESLGIKFVLHFSIAHQLSGRDIINSVAREMSGDLKRSFEALSESISFSSLGTSDFIQFRISFVNRGHFVKL